MGEATRDAAQEEDNHAGNHENKAVALGILHMMPGHVQAEKQAR